jgi:hyperosmotically inducible periplasmic protein
MKLSTTIKPTMMSLALAVILSAAGCTAMTGQSTGQYVDDRTITASVKSKLVADRASNLTRVDVDTTNRVVSLNGVVESTDQKRRAEELAAQVSGVRRVDNNLQVQGRN